MKPPKSRPLKNGAVAKKALTDDDKHTVKIDFQRLPQIQKFYLLLLIQEREDAHPLITHAKEHSHVQLFELLRFIKATLIISFGSVERDINHHVLLIEREGLYQKLVTANAPKKMLQHLFAKTSRQIERERCKCGLGKQKLGRPPSLRGPAAYEVMGRWEELSVGESDLAKLLVMINEDFPQVNIGSIYNLISDK